MNNFDYSRRQLFSGLHLIGLICIFAGVFVLLSPMFLESETPLEKILIVGAVSVVIGLIIVTTYSGTLIDVAGNKVKEYVSVCSCRFGKWTTLPAISAIKVVSTSHIHTNIPNGISPTLSGKVREFNMLLFSEHRLPELSFTYTSKDQAIEEARQLATAFDATLELNFSDHNE